MRAKRTLTVAEAFAEAMQAYQQGKAANAQRLAKQLAEANPDFGGAHYLLGLLALDKGQAGAAIGHLARALAITPGEPALHFAMASALEKGDDLNSAILHYRSVLSADPLHAEANARLGELLRRAGRTGEAIDHCRKVVAANANHAEALNCLGALMLEAGHPEEAARHLKAALEVRPSWAAALNNYGLALHRLGRLEEAATIIAGAVEGKPDHAGFRANLASAYRALGRLDQARAEADRAVKADSRCVDAWIELGLVRQAQGHADGAAAAFDRAVAVEPRLPRAHWCLAEACRTLGQNQRAARHYRVCLNLDPDDSHGAALALALVGGAPAPDKAPAAFLRQLFDDYAENFDAALVERLDYRAPALVASALARVMRDENGAVPTGIEVMDAGCGTGLMAPVLRPLAARLAGIDLSSAMVAKARERGLYDELAEGDLVPLLAQRPDRYDLVVAADVLVYLGNLAPVMAAVRHCLRPMGLFVFTVERADGIASYMLGPKSRYSHARDYVLSVAAEAGFDVILVEDAVTRLEAGNDVPCLLAVLRRRE
jgi:predicted TPR repeat methyltransferase